MSSLSSRRGLWAACAVVSLGGLAGCGGPPPARIGDTSISSYVALGDGFAAAPYAGTETDRNSGCLRSNGGYPTRLAQELKIEDFVDVSCTYAKSEALLRTTVPLRGDGEESVPPQLDAVKEDTELVTLTIGFSDRRLLGDLFDMCVALPCLDEDEPSAAEVVGRLARIASSVSTRLAAIEEKAPNAEIILVGYPRLAPDEGSCDELPDLDQAELDAVNAVQARFNDLLSGAARSNGADFIDVDELSLGHDICADDPWVGGRTSAGKGPVRFHPKAALEEAVAAELLEQVGP